MLVRLGVVACLFWLHFAYATILKIINIVPFGSSSVKISFNQEIKKFKEVSLKNFKSYLELEAILTIPKKHYQFSKQSFITIAQFSPKLARVVISHAPKMTYEVKILKDKLYVSIVEKKPLTRHQMAPKHQVLKPPKHHALKHQVLKPAPKSIKKEAKEVKEKTPTKHARSKHTHSQWNERSAKKEIPKKEAENESKNQVFIAEKNDASIKTKRKKHKKIVLDAGHGGKDCGAMSANLVCEKDIVLEVVKFLHKELKKRGYSVLLTRDKDIYIDLVARTELANKKSADLFISVHANSIPKRSTSNAHGIETYFLSTARSERARKVAEQENKDDVNLMDYFSKNLLLNSLNTQRLIVSNKLAIDVQYGMLQSVRKNYPDVVDGGVREGPFWVLAGALMPSILIEIGYNSHAIESKRIQSKPYQKILAKGIADGIDSFFSKND
ncbi:N-acetylmuramoyl-L-alanine amidase family protein [Helicobacter pylori]|uniref:N-acetylmuramoyl-L-alanine amidase family protein n=1 Tax=Helicobacter pylori TaxID=210 RepID=UPI001923517F|nr:N-acetylmuramoyl-L-alanine amidase [Helicobacter pylori]QQW67580.1 N-acetylmuramoyl-L-alanine amidase [Helicobacter pylori]QQW94970.1 N-acetylmuramoyl-L-alanine amidase [Helicobacter pylori]QQW97851.1 N-acetylmuramoyl-L-alanine amidase [Helicobacter pylori]